MTIAEINTIPAPARVQWDAVLAGAAIATAFALVLLSFGAALGLGVASPYEGEGLSPVAFAIAAGLYLLWVQVMSFYMGGYVTTRMRARDVGASEHETDVRDGLHGLVMWGVGVIAAGVIAFAGIGGIGVTAQTSPDQISTSVERVVDQQVRESAAGAEASDADAATATDAQRRADVARKLGVISAFIAAASLLAGAAAAFFGAHAGGNHRDKNVAWAFFTSYARPR